jgi:hypothetical protein
MCNNIELVHTMITGFIGCTLMEFKCTLLQEKWRII